MASIKGRPKEIPCLKCKEMFQSKDHVYNRICYKCKINNEAQDQGNFKGQATNNSKRGVRNEH